jgi:hypothetical protein
MKYLRPTKEQMSQAATLTIAAYVVPQFQMPFRAQLLHKDVNPTEFNKHWLQYLTGERRAMRHVAEALVTIMNDDMGSVPQGLGSYFTVMQQLLQVEDAALRHKLLVGALAVHFDMIHTQRSMFENSIKDFVQLVVQSKGIVQGSVVREVEDIIFATAVTEYMKEAAEQAAAQKEATDAQPTNND